MIGLRRQDNDGIRATGATTVALFPLSLLQTFTSALFAFTHFQQKTDNIRLCLCFYGNGTSNSLCPSHGMLGERHP
jgi:hypothetical protein